MNANEPYQAQAHTFDGVDYPNAAKIATKPPRLPKSACKAGHPFWSSFTSVLVASGTFAALAWLSVSFVDTIFNLPEFLLAVALFSVPAALAYVVVGHRQKSLFGRFIVTPVLPLLLATVAIEVSTGAVRWSDAGIIGTLALFVIGGAWSAAILRGLMLPSKAKREAKRALKKSRRS